MAKKKRAAAKSRGSKKGAGVNKAKAIRDYCEAHPEDGPLAVASALNKQNGWEISAQYVSTIKSNAKKSASKKVKRASSSPGKAGDTDTFSVSTLLTAKKLAEELGGVRQAKAALDAVSKLVS